MVLSLESGRSRGDAINHEAVLAVLPDSREEAKSTKEIADAMELEISSYVDWVRTELRSVRALGALMKWGAELPAMRDRTKREPVFRPFKGGCIMLRREGLESIKGIIFDCYNTLIDIRTDEDSIETYRPISNWLIYQGVKIDADELMSEYKRMVKEELDSRWEKYPEIKVELVFSRICKQHALWDIDESALGIQTACAFRAASLRRLRAFHQSLRLLMELEGTPMGIVSNAQKVFSELELRYLDLSRHFKFVIFSSEFGHKKPDPRIFLEGASRLGLKPEEILSIGDNMEHDITPSAKLGMKAMHIEEAWKLFGVF